MTMMQTIAAPTERVLAILKAGLEIEFGHGAGEGLARQFLAAEDVDFRWDARCDERWLGAYESATEEDFWLDRIAIYGQLDGEWFAAVILVDGEGEAHGMLGCRGFDSQQAAMLSMAAAR